MSWQIANKGKIMNVKLSRNEEPRSTNRIVVDTKFGELRIIEQYGNLRIWFVDGEDSHEMVIKPASGNEFVLKFIKK